MLSKKELGKSPYHFRILAEVPAEKECCSPVAGAAADAAAGVDGAAAGAVVNAAVDAGAAAGAAAAPCFRNPAADPAAAVLHCNFAGPAVIGWDRVSFEDPA